MTDTPGGSRSARARAAADAIMAEIAALLPLVGGPVQAGGLWHLATVLDIRDPQNADIANETTRIHTRRRYIHEKLDEYVVGLRKDKYEVKVFEDTITRLAQQEVDMVEQLTERAQDPNSITRQRLEEMQTIMQQQP